MVWKKETFTLSKARVLWITGACGAIGSKLVMEAAKQDLFEQIWAFTHTPSFTGISTTKVSWSVLDISDWKMVQTTSQHNPPSIIINLAAMTNVDTCEMLRYEAKCVNCNGPANLAEVCRRHDAHMIQVSTDYIFPGDEDHPGPYLEDSRPRPINYDGQTKLDGELAVVETCGVQVPFTIVRTAQVYGSTSCGRQNFVMWLISKLMAGEPIQIIREQWSTPTLVDDLVKALLWIAEHGKIGIYHLAGPEVLSLYEWALIIVNHFGLDENLIEWVAASEFLRKAKRPRFGGLSCYRFDKDITIGAPLFRGMIEALVSIDWYSALKSN